MAQSVGTASNRRTGLSLCKKGAITDEAKEIIIASARTPSAMRKWQKYFQKSVGETVGSLRFSEKDTIIMDPGIISFSDNCKVALGLNSNYF